MERYEELKKLIDELRLDAKAYNIAHVVLEDLNLEDAFINTMLTESTGTGKENLVKQIANILLSVNQETRKELLNKYWNL